MSTRQAAQALPKGRYGTIRAGKTPRWRMWVFTAVAIVVGAVAFVSTWLPARRAAALDPIRALRQE